MLMTSKFSALVGSVVVLLVLAGVGGGIAWIKKQQILAAMANGGPPEMPEAVTIYAAKPAKFRLSTLAVGTVVAPRWVTLRNEVSGSVAALHVTSGSHVEANTVMIELDKSVEQASMEAASARVRITESTFKRLKSARSQATTELEIEQAEAELAQAQAEHSRLQAIIEKKTMRAPFAAKVGLLNLHPGQYLSEGTEITFLQGVDDYILVDFMVSQTVADQVALDQAVLVRHGELCLPAKLVALDTKADRSTRNTMMRAELRNPPPNLTPNDSVDIEIEYGPELSGLSIPIAAIRRTPSGAHVFVAEGQADGSLKASMRTVIPGKVLGDQQVIMQGLEDGDQVIADGSFKLDDGSKVSNLAKAGSAL